MLLSFLVKNSHLRIYLSLLLFFLVNLLVSQDYTYDLDEYGFEDGLAYKQINTVFEDRDGLIWLGTSKGLVR